MLRYSTTSFLSHPHFTARHIFKEFVSLLFQEYKHLLRSMAEHLAQYWKDSGFTGSYTRSNLDESERTWCFTYCVFLSPLTIRRSLDGFWKQFGYISNDVEEEPSDEPKYARKRAMQLPCTVQCGNCSCCYFCIGQYLFIYLSSHVCFISVKCLKWRTLPFSAKNIGRTFEDEWTCALNSDPERNK